MEVDAELSRILREGARLWNAHRFFQCHDKLEEAWRMTKHEKKAERASDPRRDVFHGIILYSAAYVHWMKGNPVGVQRKLADARKVFPSGGTPLFGLELDGFRRTVEADLERGSRGEAYVARRVPAMEIENS